LLIDLSTLIMSDEPCDLNVHCGSESVTTLSDHSGTPTNVGGKMFQARLDRGENADEVAVALWRESRGEKSDNFDGPILYHDRWTPV